MRKLYRKLGRVLYLLRKLINSTNKTLVIYDRVHPIYSVPFEELSDGNFVYAYIENLNNCTFWEFLLLKRAKIMHSDVANDYFNYKNHPDKLIFLWAEITVRESEVAPPEIKKIYLMSRFGFLNSEVNIPKMCLLYPGVIVPQEVERDPQKPVITIAAVGYGGLIKSYDVIFKLYETLKDRYRLKWILAGNLAHDFDIYPEIKRDVYERANFPHIESVLKADPNVVLRPFKRPDLMTEVYPKADIYLHISRMETFGFSVLEAMSYSLPVIATRFNALPEMVVPGENGFLVNNFFDNRISDVWYNAINTQAWFDATYEETLAALITLIENPELRLSMGKKSYNMVKQKFDANERLAKIEADYTHFLNGGTI
ncbi:MAG: glycosyltransferase [Chitinophagia bacterium]|nr:glycosyltransferase [Chitinophagia bacterium]